MKKGRWLANLVRRVLDTSISPRDAITFFLSRLPVSSRDLRLQGVVFEEVNHTLWSLIAEIFINQEYSPPGFEIAAKDVVVDVGAHRGVFLAYAALRTTNTIHAFEPNHDNFRSLQQLVRRNKFDHVQLRNYALGKATGREMLFYSKSSSRHTLTGIDQRTGNALAVSYFVPTLSMREALEGIPKVDLLKMDCEGAEFEILMNADKDTLRKVRRLVLEYHISQATGSLEGLIAFLEGIYSDVVLQEGVTNRLGIIYASRP